MDKVPKK